MNNTNIHYVKFRKIVDAVGTCIMYMFFLSLSFEEKRVILIVPCVPCTCDLCEDAFSSMVYGKTYNM